jgi:rRNA processing protein Krr1/Pno1
MTDSDIKLSPRENNLKKTLDKVNKSITLALNEGKGVHLELDCKDGHVTIKTTLTEKTEL